MAEDKRGGWQGTPQNVSPKDRHALLDIFRDWLEQAQLSVKTIERHMSNANFFLDAYLPSMSAETIQDACGYVPDYLGYFLIHKCTWTSANTIRQNATSLKKFFLCMVEHGYVRQDSYDQLVADIKEGLPVWTAEIGRLNGGSGPSVDELLNMGGKGLLDAVYDAVAQHLGFDGMDFDGMDFDDYEPPTRQDAINELTLALLYLTSWKEEVFKGTGITRRRAWKSADWNALDFLREAGLISGTNQAKSVCLTDEGLFQAERTLSALGLEHLIEDDEDGSGGDGGPSTPSGGQSTPSGWTVIK